MKNRALPLAVFAFLLLPTLLPAQTGGIQELPLPPAPSFRLSPPASNATAITPAPNPCHKCPRHAYLFAQPLQKPLTPRDVQMREVVQALGVDKHRFVRCRLNDGSQLVGGITFIHQGKFVISQGIWNSREIAYSELREAPQPTVAVGEHLENGLNWTGLVATCVVLSPLVIPLIPLMFTGVIAD